MNNQRLTDILQIINTEGIGPVTFYKYMKAYNNDAARALEALSQKKKVFSRQAAEDEIDLAERSGVKILAYDSSDYPESLREIPDAPPVLYAKGRTDLLKYPLALAIVGARNASINGRKIASKIAYDLTQSDVLVISGMARGIDSSAHKGSMFAKDQQGPTIAVLGTGVDEIYPAENKSLYESICQQGLLLSEFRLGTTAQAQNFPRRNRIISALSAGTLVVEAGLHSGSLITARTALEQGKEIFAVPGSPLENRSQGPNHLIKEGAILTESAEDILNVLSMTQNKMIKNTKMTLKPLDKAENNVNISQQNNAVSETVRPAGTLLELITYTGIDIDELLRSCGLPQATFFSELLELEFAGKIERQTGNRVARIK